MKKFLNIFVLVSTMLLAACNVGKTDTVDATTGTTVTTYAGTYNGSVTGVNAGTDAKIIVGSDNSVSGTWTITNRGDDGKGSYVTTFSGSVDGSGNINFDGTFRGLRAMKFTGQIDLATGALTGTWLEYAYPTKGGAFSLTREGGVTTTTTGTSASGCTGSYVGSVNPPPKAVRIAARNRYLTILGKPITGNDAIDNAGTGGGGLDGGMYLQGSFKWETDANCKVIKGVTVLHGHTFNISGTVAANKIFTLSFAGPIVGQVDANNGISGQVQEPGRTWVYGDMVGTFTPNGKI